MEIKPVRDGVISALSVFLASLIGLSSLWWTASDELLNEVRLDLGRLAGAVASVIDGDIHESLVEPELMDGLLYFQALKPLKSILSSDSGIKYIYTLRLEGDKILFVLDAAEPGDNDGDGVEDRADLGEVYEVDIPELTQALKPGVNQQQPITTSEPYTDKWGSFMTGYAPILNSSGKKIGVVGVDITVENYLQRLASAKRSMLLGLFPAIVASLLLGYMVYRLRLKTVSDYNEQKRLRDISQQSEKRFRDLFYLSPDPVLIFDKDVFIECNQAAVKMLEYPDAQSLLNIHPSEISPQNQPDGESSFAKAERMLEVARVDGVNRFEWMHSKYDKTNFWCEVTLSLFKADNRDMIYCVVRDISSRKAIEHELSAKTVQLEKLNWDLEEKIRARTNDLELEKNKAEEANQEKSRFLANMSHELRTPMHAIHSFTKLAMKREIDAKARHFLENIDVSTNRLTDLLNDLLDLSKLESGKIDLDVKETDVGLLVKDTVKPLESLINEHNLHIDQRDIVDVVINVDKKLITQVITNLLSNAIKFSPEGGRIKVTASAIANQFTLSVEDEGVGVPLGEHDAIFDSFVQSTKTMTNSGGTGLGLPISKEIIELHGGKIWAESPPPGKQKGSVFTFELPMK